MKNVLTVACLIFAIYGNGVAIGQSSGSGGIELSTPTEITFTWRDARDLSISFENAEDRIALANLVVNECQTNSSLSDLARLDGYRISGHICYRDGDLDLATTAFNEVLGLDTTPRWKAEAHRMLGQLAFSAADFELAKSHFIQAWNFTEVDDPDLQYTTSLSILNLACSTSELVGSHEDTLNYALVGLSKFSQPDRHRDRAQYLFWAYQANKSLGDSAAALTYLEEILTDHPDFQAGDPRGIILELHLDQYILRGEDWDNPTKEFIAEVISIVYDYNYLFSMSRVEILRKLANFVEEHGKHDAAIYLRTTQVTELENAIDNEDSFDPFLRSVLLSQTSTVKYDNAKHLASLGRYADASVLLQEIISSPLGNVDPNTLQSATELNTRVLERMQAP